MLYKLKKYLGITIIFSLFSQNIIIPSRIYAKPNTNIKEKINQNDKNIADLKQKKSKQCKNQKELESKISSVTKQMNGLSLQIKNLKKQTYGKQKEINSFLENYKNLQDQVKNIDSEIANITKNSQDLKEELLKCLKYTYMNGESDYLEAFLSSKNYIDFVNNIKYTKKFSERTKTILEEYTEKINKINSMKNEKEKDMQQIEETKQKIEIDINHNTDKTKQIEKLIKQEHENYNILGKLLKENKKESKEINNSIKIYQKMNNKLNKELQDSSKAINEILKKNKTNQQIPQNNNTQQANVKSNKNNVFPVLGTSSISRGFKKGHQAIDIQTYGKPNPVVASKAGTVIVATKGGKNNYLSGYGNVIIIQHGSNETTLYAHLSTIKVKVGQVVNQGEIIGNVGNTGRVRGSSGMHLHYEHKVNSNKVSPVFK